MRHRWANLAIPFPEENARDWGLQERFCMMHRLCFWMSRPSNLDSLNEAVIFKIPGRGAEETAKLLCWYLTGNLPCRIADVGVFC